MDELKKMLDWQAVRPLGEPISLPVNSLTDDEIRSLYREFGRSGVPEWARRKMAKIHYKSRGQVQTLIEYMRVLDLVCEAIVVDQRAIARSGMIRWIPEKYVSLDEFIQHQLGPK